MDSGTIAFWVLAVSAFLAWLSVVIKLAWWKSTIGYWFFIVTGTVGLLCAFIFTLQMDWWPDVIKNNARAIIYSSLALVFLLLVTDIWRKNPRHWAWSERD